MSAPASGPFLALPRGASARHRRGSLERAYDAFLLDGSVHPDLRPVVAESWRLCRAHGVSPDGVLPVVDLLDAELEGYRNQHPLATVMPLIRRLLIEDAEDQHAIVVVADANARLLWVEGDRDLRRRAESMNWVEGSRWDEQTAGTNAPAAAVRLDHALQVFAREHYASNVAAWSCTAAPIHDPLTGQVLGALDITGRDDVAAPAMLNLVRAAAAAAESELLVRTMRRPSSRTIDIAPRAGVSRAAPTDYVLRVLGRDRAALVPDGRADAAIELSQRHSELLYLLATHPAGHTADQLAIAMNERDIPAVTVRAELSRMRNLVPGLQLTGRPYRIASGVRTDAGEVRDLLSAGRLRDAVAAYAGQILPSSQSPDVTSDRDCLDREIRSAVVGSDDVTAVRQFAESMPGRDDHLVWRRLVRLADPALRPVLLPRLAQIERDLGIAR